MYSIYVHWYFNPLPNLQSGCSQISYRSILYSRYLMFSCQVIQLSPLHHCSDPGLQLMFITRYPPNITLKTRAAVFELRHLGDGLSVMS